MEIKEIPIPTMPDWLKLYNTYDPEYYTPGKRVSAEEWNTLFLASVRQGNYNADTLELLIKTYLPETYLTQVNFNQFSNEMRTAYSTFTNNIQEDLANHKTQVHEQYDTFTTQVQEDFTALTNEVNSLEERVVNAEDVAYSLNDVIQEANEYAQAANQTAIEANTFAQEANDNAGTALETANSAASVAASSNTTAQDALSTAQSAVTTANTATTQATQAVNTANAASLRADDAIVTANAAKIESASAKSVADTAAANATTALSTSQEAKDTADTAEQIAQNALDLVTEGVGSQVLVNGVSVDTFNADTKADVTYVNQKIDDIMGPGSTEAIDTILELAAAFESNSDVIEVLNDAISTKADKSTVDALTETVSTKADKSTVDALTETVSTKANTSALSAVTDASLSSDSKTLTVTKRDGTSFAFQDGPTEYLKSAAIAGKKLNIINHADEQVSFEGTSVPYIGKFTIRANEYNESMDDVEALKAYNSADKVGIYLFETSTTRDSIMGSMDEVWIMYVRQESWSSIMQTLFNLGSFFLYSRSYSPFTQEWTVFKVTIPVTKVDSELSASSSNPVQNRAVTAALPKLGTTNWSVSQSSSGELVFTYTA